MTLVLLLAACSRQATPEMVCLSRVIGGVIKANKPGNPDILADATTMASAEAKLLQTISTEGCTAEQRADISKMAAERQIVADAGLRLLAIQSGKEKAFSKAESAKTQASVTAATQSYFQHFAKLNERLSELSGDKAP